MKFPSILFRYMLLIPCADIVKYLFISTIVVCFSFNFA